MILLRTADRTGRQWLVPAGVHGYFPAEFPTAGEPSPLENDADLPGDADTQFLWWLRTPLLDATSNGTTTVSDAGAYTHTGADDGTWQQGYAWRALLADGSIESSVDVDAVIEFTIGSGLTVSTGLATETDTALALSLRKVRAAGLATETDTALALALVKRRAVALATETDAALALTLRKIVAAGLATETDAALALDLDNLGPGLNVATATETDTALPLSLVKRMPAAISAETDTALQRSIRRAVQAAMAAETDTAAALAIRKIRAVGMAVETDTALDLAWRAFRVQMAIETDVALALSFVSTVVDLSTFHRYEVPGEIMGYTVPGNTYTIEV